MLGGGVIGVEFASVWRSFGVEVTIVEALPHLLPAEDVSSSKALERAFRKRGIAFQLGRRFTSLTSDDRGVTVSLDDGSELVADYVLVAVGRGPATSGLGFEEAGVVLERGFVQTDSRLRTAAAHVWAVGDIVPGLQLAHRGFQQGIFVAEEIAGLSPVLVPDVDVPRVAYSHPEVASVGLTEAQAQDRYGSEAVRAYEYNLAVTAVARSSGPRGSSRSCVVSTDPSSGPPRGRSRGRADLRSPARRRLGSASRRHRAVRPRAPHPERGARRGLPGARGQAAARTLTDNRSLS